MARLVAVVSGRGSEVTTRVTDVSQDHVLWLAARLGTGVTRAGHLRGAWESAALHRLLTEDRGLTWTAAGGWAQAGPASVTPGRA